jgi:hypothetical protein
MIKLGINMILNIKCEIEYKSSINFFYKSCTNAYQPWSWYVFMIIGKTPNLKQCSTMKQQRQTSLNNFG